MRKAQNLVEILLLACLVAVVSITVAIMYNNQKTRLAGLSNSASSAKAVNLNNASAAKLNEVVPYTKIETAGTSALKFLAMSSSAFASAMANNVQYSELSEPDSKGNNILKYGADLSSQLGLGYSFSATNITTGTLSDLVGVLNAITAEGFNPTNDPNIAAAAAGFKERFNSILDAATGTNLSSETAGSNGYKGSSASNSTNPDFSRVADNSSNYNFSNTTSDSSTYSRNTTTTDLGSSRGTRTGTTVSTRPSGTPTNTATTSGGRRSSNPETVTTTTTTTNNNTINPSVINQLETAGIRASTNPNDIKIQGGGV